jgi:hypothetical protein
MLDAIGPVVEKTLAPYPAAVERALKAQAAPAEPAEAAQTESKEDTRG